MSIRCGYCGSDGTLPAGYDYFESRNKCLRKGFGAGIGTEKRKWQRKLGIRIRFEHHQNPTSAFHH